MKTKKQVQLTCTNCGTELDVDSLLVTQFEQSIRKDLAAELKEREQQLAEQRHEVQNLSLSLEKEREDLDALVNNKVKSQLLSREQLLRQSIKAEIESEKQIQLTELQDELSKKSKQLISLNQTKAKMARLEQEFAEKESEIILKKEEEFQSRINAMKSDVRVQIQMENDIKLKEQESLISSLNKKLIEAKNQIGYGSRLAGEGLELALEDMLRQTHPDSDIIEEVGKGVRGADIEHTVVTQFGNVVGKIIYESKNTKSFSPNFLSQLKQNRKKAMADIAVLVTRTLPSGATNRFNLIDGIWVVTPENAKDLSLMLRYGLLKTFAVMQTQDGKKGKMELLYKYLTSTEFKDTFESILEGFKLLQDSHNQEQLKMQALWKKREKYLSQVLSSTVEFYGSIKGISGEIPNVGMLEIPEAS